MRICARRWAVVGALGGLLALTGCGSTNSASWHEPGSDGSPVAANEAAGVTVTTPADGATNVPTAVELALSGALDADSTITLTDAAGVSVAGAMRADGSSWLPSTQLSYATTYTATVTGKRTSKVTFTTMAKPSKTISATIAMSDNKVYGVGMPVVVRFASTVPADQRASVEKRLMVTSEPAQIGGWHWFSESEVHFRPKEYWQANTRLSVRIAIGGLPMGANVYGLKDVTIVASIGEKIIMSTDDKTHMMTVTKQDQVVKTIPISLGKPTKTSSSGNMVVMDKNQSEIFQSTEPGDEYRMTVYWTQRMTTGGEYIHAAPWSVGDQGKRNVSHGCTNMSTENAKWLWEMTHIGDPVIVLNTSRKLEWGNGWTDWDRSWDEYVKGSALPVPTG